MEALGLDRAPLISGPDLQPDLCNLKPALHSLYDADYTDHVYSQKCVSSQKSKACIIVVCQCLFSLGSFPLEAVE